MAKVTSKVAVVVLAVGEKGRQLHDFTYDGLKAYADKIGADYHAITGDPIYTDYPQADKFRVGQYLDYYDRVLYFDADIVVTDDAPNLFDLVPEDKLGIVNEHLYVPGNHARDINEIQKANGFKVQNPKAYFNAGLMVISKAHRAVFSPPTVPFRVYHCAEQDLINARIIEYGTQLHQFGPDTVWLYFADPRGRKKKGRPFQHYAGASTVRGSRGHLVEMGAIDPPDPFAPTLTEVEKNKLYELLRRVDQVLESSYVLAYGALLGWNRHKDLLPWDDDVDVLCLNPPTAEELQARLPDLKVYKDAHGLLKVYDPANPPCPGKPHTFPFVDICPASLEDGKVVHLCTNGPHDKFDIDIIFPTHRAKLGPVEVNIPSNPKKLLVQKYGIECLTSALPSNWSHRHERKTGFRQVRRPLSEVLPEPANIQKWYLLNLDRRPDRLKEATEQLQKAGIEFTRFPAVDGKKLPLPSNEKNGAGAFGCRLSHLRILEDAITHGLDCVGILEDDIVIADPDNFRTRLDEAFNKLPKAWDMLYLGGQHRKPATPTGVEGIVRCEDCHRTHSYIVRGKAIKRLYDIWSTNTGHVDHILGRGYFKELKAFAVTPWLTGQGESKSDINGREQKERWWEPKGNVTVVKSQPAPVDPNCKPCAKKAAIKKKLAELRAKRGR